MKLSLSLVAWVLTIVFVVLKLTSVIAWSWWLVFLPLMIWAGIVVVILFFLLAVVGLVLKYGD